MPNLPLPTTVRGATGLNVQDVDQNAQYFRYPDNLGQPPFDKWIYFEAKSGRHVVRDQVIVENGSVDRTLSAVGLYLSETALKNSLTVAYEENALGPFTGAIVELMAQTGKNLTDAIMGAGTDWMNQLKQSLKTVGGTAVGTAVNSFKDIIVTDLFAGISHVALGDAGTSEISGLKPNPRTDVLFNTQEYRTYDMNFLLVPRSLAEAQSIDRILHFFQFYMLPKYENPSTQGKIGSFMLGFPYEFEISLRDGRNNRLEHVNKFERLVLTNILIDHAAGGKTAFIKADNGELFPVATSLSLTFKEVRLLDRNSDAITRQTTQNETGLPDPRS